METLSLNVVKTKLLTPDNFSYAEVLETAGPIHIHRSFAVTVISKKSSNEKFLFVLKTLRHSHLFDRVHKTLQY